MTLRTRLRLQITRTVEGAVPETRDGLRYRHRRASRAVRTRPWEEKRRGRGAMLFEGTVRAGGRSAAVDRTTLRTRRRMQIDR